MKSNKLKNNVTKTSLTLSDQIDKTLKVSAAKNQEQPVISKRRCRGKHQKSPLKSQNVGQLVILFAASYFHGDRPELLQF